MIVERERRVWIALLMGWGISSLVTRGKGENIGASILRSVGFGVERWRFLKVIGHEIIR